jgi:farnesyl-diphosphate farnesyltransferase
MLPALNDLLRATARSFYLTLRVLPGAIRPQISLAYLLARATDTIADTEIVPLAQRLDALQKLRERILGQNSALLDFSEFAQRQGLPAERTLLQKIEDGILALQHFSAEDQKRIREVLAVITSGQELDLQRFAGSASSKIIALQTDAELDDYTWRVAGCVGEFWTKLCRAHLFPNAKMDGANFTANGVRFGKGLQLVNILRDLPVDVQKGRCYLPEKKLAEIRLSPADLLLPANETRLRPLYNRYLDLAESHLSAGWNYTNALPFSQFRVRLACAWPILIGAKTIARLRVEAILDSRRRIKISRGEARGILALSLLSCPFPALWRKLFSPGKISSTFGTDF